MMNVKQLDQPGFQKEVKVKFWGATKPTKNHLPHLIQKQLSSDSGNIFLR